MILVFALSVLIAMALDLSLGDPKNRLQPTAWIGLLIGRLVPAAKSGDP